MNRLERQDQRRRLIVAIESVRYEGDYAVLVGSTKDGPVFETKVDPEDVEKLIRYSWYLNAYGYLCAYDPEKPTGGSSLLLHRVVMNAGPGTVVDHQFGDKMDNRKRRLRMATRKSNGQNRVKLSRKNISGRTGVRRSPNGKRWVAIIKVDYRTIGLGTFDTFDEAVAARSAAEDIHFGAFASRI